MAGHEELISSQHMRDETAFLGDVDQFLAEGSVKENGITVSGHMHRIARAFGRLVPGTVVESHDRKYIVMESGEWHVYDYAGSHGVHWFHRKAHDIAMKNALENAKMAARVKGDTDGSVHEGAAA